MSDANVNAESILTIQIGQTVPASTFPQDDSPTLRIKAVRLPARAALPCGAADHKRVPHFALRPDVVEVEFQRTNAGWLRVA